MDAPSDTTAKLTEPVLHYAEAMSKGMVSLSDEITGFIAKRAQRTSETLADLSSGQSINPGKLWEIQIKWFTTALQDYTEETQRIMQIQGRIVESMVGKKNVRNMLDERI